MTRITIAILATLLVPQFAFSQTRPFGTKRQEFETLEEAERAAKEFNHRSVGNLVDEMNNEQDRLISKTPWRFVDTGELYKPEESKQLTRDRADQIAVSYTHLTLPTKA